MAKPSQSDEEKAHVLTDVLMEKLKLQGVICFGVYSEGVHVFGGGKMKKKALAAMYAAVQHYEESLKDKLGIED